MPRENSENKEEPHKKDATNDIVQKYAKGKNEITHSKVTREEG